MSTLGQPHLEPSWRQEVNRRLAAHQNRKSGAALPAAPAHAESHVNSRAAEAAARVAARYAKAPTYSQMQSEEARLAVRAAEIATKVALEAQAAAESALAEMHAATVEAPSRGPAVVESIDRAARMPDPQPEPEPFPEPVGSLAAEEAPLPAMPEFVAELPAPEPTVAAVVVEPEPFFAPEPAQPQSFGVRWDPDLPAIPLQRKPTPAAPRQEFELATEDWWTPAEVSATLHSEPIEVAEASLAHANLIEFPRELVATRRMRPRLAEPAGSGAGEAQLSIFEVDPQTVATAPEPMEPLPESPDAKPGPEWSGMELDAQSFEEQNPRVDSSAAKDGPYLAPLGLRMMATVVDLSLILGVFFGLAMFAVSHTGQVLPPKMLEGVAAAALVLTCLLYHAFFFSLGSSTLGMKYAGIAFCTFDNESPTRAQLCNRFLAMLVSLVPLGLGMMWSVFDEDHLSWHDRISQTYLRKR